MTSDGPATDADAQRSADHLALALEDVGFDVGQDFPVLHDAVGRQGLPVVRLGDVRPLTAGRLADVLSRAAARGITLTREDNR